jgi:dipeptidyl aminopeptidase/acylaminoacyl peptidase
MTFFRNSAVVLPLFALLVACTDNQSVTEEDTAAVASAEPALMDFIAPTASDANLDSDVAPYVLARGAGPSRLSPDGRTVATRLSLTGTRQVYVMDAQADDPKSTLQQLSQGSGVTFFAFAPDGRLIYGADNNGDERENYWIVAPKANGSGWDEPRLILPATENGFRNFGGFTADSSQIVYSSTERNGEDFDIYLADVATGEARLVHEGQGGLFVQAVSPAGTSAILSESVGEDSDRLYVLDLQTGQRRGLSDPDPRANHSDAGIRYLDDNRIILATNAGQEFAALRTYQVNSSFQVGANITREATNDVDGVEVCGDTIVTTRNLDGFSSLHLQPGGTVQGLPRGVYSIDCADDAVLVRVSASNIPGDLYAFDLADPTPRRIFGSDYGELDVASLILPESVRLPARDGVEVQGLLYLPDGTISPPPVVFMVHGGPTAQARPSYNSTVQYLLSKGIAVFQSNVRGSTGFGRTYVTLDDKRKRLDSVRDLVDMLDYLEADGRVDTSRAAVMGGSYGGYMVNAVLADYPDAFDAGVSLFGVGDWVTALEIASPALKASDIIEYGDIDDPEWRDFYAEISPIAKADNIRVPVLYSHGAMDPRIDKAETEIMVRALRENGVRADYILFPDEGHGWRKLNNRLFYERMQAEFLEEVLAN